MDKIVGCSIKFGYKQETLVYKALQLASGTCRQRGYLGSQHLTGMGRNEEACVCVLLTSFAVCYCKEIISLGHRGA